MASIDEIRNLLEPLNNKIDKLQNSLNLLNKAVQNNKEANIIKFEKLEEELKRKDKQIEYLDRKLNIFRHKRGKGRKLRTNHRKIIK